MDQLRVVLVLSALIVGACSTKTCVQRGSDPRGEIYWNCAFGCCNEYTHEDPCCGKIYDTDLSFYVGITAAIVVPLVVTIAICLVIQRSRQHKLSSLQTPPPIQLQPQQQVFHTPGTNLGTLPPSPNQPFHPLALPSFTEQEAAGVNGPPPPIYTPSPGKRVDQKNMPSL